ncbi:MAG TPA: hypothetical protein VM406_02820 [Noviherbaspirillum sp.]|nr:hypothetical protein [Noviherbaspirillum sp.]
MDRPKAAIARIVLAGLLVVAGAGCEREDRTAGEPGPAERAGERLDHAFSRAGEELNKMAERTGKHMEDFGRRLQNEAQQARREKEARRAEEARQAQAASEAQPGQTSGE